MHKVLVIAFLGFTLLLQSQQQEVDWLSFEELEQKLTVQPKKVLVYFYADWCVYCKKMDQAVYKKPRIKALLQQEYYAVKFNSESTDTIYFGGKRFVNDQLGGRRNPVHQIPEFLAGKPNKPLELPATIILDENFNIVKRFFRYIPPKEMLALLEEK